MQLELDLQLDPITQFEIDIQFLKNQQEVLRKSFFARTHAMEKDVENLKNVIQNQNREIEVLKNLLTCLGH